MFTRLVIIYLRDRVSYFKIGKRSLVDDSTQWSLENRESRLLYCRFAKAGLDVPDQWRHGRILLLKRLILVQRMTLIITLLSERELVGVDKVAMPGEGQSRKNACESRDSHRRESDSIALSKVKSVGI